MKLALLISFAQDRRSAIVHGQPLPADQVISQVKSLITTGKPLDPRFPIVCAFDLSSRLRESRFNVPPLSVDQLTELELQDAATGSKGLDFILDDETGEKITVLTSADLEKLEDIFLSFEKSVEELKGEHQSAIEALQIQVKDLNAQVESLRTPPSQDSSTPSPKPEGKGTKAKPKDE